LQTLPPLPDGAVAVGVVLVAAVVVVAVTVDGLEAADAAEAVVDGDLVVAPVLDGVEVTVAAAFIGVGWAGSGSGMASLPVERLMFGFWVMKEPLLMGTGGGVTMASSRLFFSINANASGLGTSTYAFGNRPVFPLRSPFHHSPPLLSNTVTNSPAFREI